MRAQIVEGRHLRLLSQHDEALQKKYGYVENVTVAWSAKESGWGAILTEDSTISFEANGSYSYDDSEGPYYSMKFRIFAHKTDPKLGDLGKLPEMDYHLLCPSTAFTGESGVYNFLPQSTNGVFNINPVRDLNEKYKKGCKSLRVEGIGFTVGDSGYLDVDNIRISNITFRGGEETVHDYTIQLTGDSGVTFRGNYSFYPAAGANDHGKYSTQEWVSGTVPVQYSFKGALISCSFQKTSPEQNGALKFVLIKDGNVVREQKLLRNGSIGYP